MRRKVGVQAFKAKQTEKEAFKDLGKELQDANIQHVTSLMATFKESLEEFARKYKRDINANPVFRNEFQKMCTKIGVDPLASNKGFWAQLLGVGDFYYELAVQIIEICLVTRSLNGGLMSLQDLTQRLRKRRKLDRISQDDVRTAIGKVHLLGAGFQLLEYGNNTLVVSVPTELSSDHTAILQMAQSTSCVTMSTLLNHLNWEEKRIKIALNLMMQGGMVWIDDQGKDGPYAKVYWFPSLWQQSRLEASSSDLGSAAGGGSGGSLG